MSRKKQYIESEVLDKAMQLFWKNGYKNTSMQMLEKEMGINKFSIYSSFGSKQGLYLKSLKSYEERTKFVFEKIKLGTRGVEDIKEFFYDSLEVCKMEGNEKGCLLVNTYLEFCNSDDEGINTEIDYYRDRLRALFMEKLRLDKSKDEATILRETNYLILAKQGLSSVAKINADQEIKDYIEMTFKNI